jgi:hypothetical protein
VRQPLVDNPEKSIPAVRSIHIKNIIQTQLIDFVENELTQVLLSFAQNEIRYGYGNNIHYNFVKIEMELANQLIVGKAFIEMDDTFPVVVYASELFVSCASVLEDFKTQVVQHPISPAIISGIKERQQSNPDYVQRMMRQTEVLLSLVKKTGGSADQTIDSYIQAWQKTLPGGFSAHLLPSGGEPLRLSHLVALYECLENMQADIVINTLDDNLKEPLSVTMKEEIRDFVDSFPASILEIALKRFIIRNLVNFDLEHIDLNQSLSCWIVEPSLWPDGGLDARGMSLDDIKRNVENKFPKMLNLSHVHSVVDFIKQIVTIKIHKSSTPSETDTGSF